MTRFSKRRTAWFRWRPMFSRRQAVSRVFTAWPQLHAKNQDRAEGRKPPPEQGSQPLGGRNQRASALGQIDTAWRIVGASRPDRYLTRSTIASPAPFELAA